MPTISLSDSKTRSRLYTTIGYCAAFIALGLTTASLGPTLTDLAANTRSALAQISYGFTARALGYLLGSFLSGRLYDRRPGNPLMGTMLLLMALSMALIPLIPVLWVLIAVMLLLGMFEGAVDVGGNTLLVWLHGDKVGPYMNAMHFFFGVGAFLSPVVVARVLAVSGGVTWAYWILALLIAPVAVAMLRLPSPSSSADERAASGEQPATAPRRTPAVLVTLIAVFFFLYVGSEGSFGGWIATYAKATGLGDPATAAYLTSVFWGALTLGRLLSIPLAARLRPRTLLLGDLIGCLLSMLVVILWPGAPVALWIGTFGAGFSMASIFPTMISFAGRHLATTGKTTAWFFVGSSSGGMVIPWLIGQWFESVSPRVTMFVILVCLVLDLLVFTTVLRAVRKPATAMREVASA
ncbi:MAG TPA: MFS transporter [Anaerolineae bacterium]|nr:MFS transporter [Anaerolineae bacterium]HQK12822.1 MFS transporter [Anaerolineae bacterium]